ncbi:MAG: hypothetical protein ACPGYT_05390 [Nitrospirales bacterium]
MSGCFSLPQIETPVHQSPQGQIILKTFSHDSVKSTHPSDIENQLLQEALRGLRIHQKRELLATLIHGEDQNKPVFTEDEIKFLTPHLIKALSQSTAEEYVWFQVQSLEQNHPTVTNGHLYITGHLLRVGLNTFHVDSRQKRLSSKASFSPTHVLRWTLGFYPDVARHTQNEDVKEFPIQTTIGFVSIDLNALQDSKHPKLLLDGQEKDSKNIQGLEEEIGELQEQLKEQHRKLRQLEDRLE